jgi:hypothetical protein
MAAPNYSPSSFGATSTDSNGVTWIFQKPGQWVAASSGANQAPMTYAPSSGTTAKAKSWQDLPGYAGWNATDAAADFAATGGAGKEGATTGGGVTNGSDFADIFAQLAASPTEIPPITVKSQAEYDQEALAQLTPYYNRILQEEGGDVEKAKVRLQQDYQRGLRVNQEDYKTAVAGYGAGVNPGETIQDYYNRTKGLSGTNPQEGISLLDELAKRGIMNSGFAKTDTANLATAQQRRQEALQTAKNRYIEQAGVTNNRAVEDAATAWQRRQFELGQQKTVDAATLAREQRSDEIATQQIEQSNLMRKAINNIYA